MRLFQRWLARRLGSKQSSHSRPRRTKIHLEVMEDRIAPATYTVNSLGDTSASGTLRWAVAQVNADASDDTIVFASTLPSGTIQLSSADGGALALTRTSGSVTIDGPGAGLLTVSGTANGSVRVFSIAGGLTVSLS